MDQESDRRHIAGRYALVSVLGRGGMGVVWRGEDLLLRRDVAVKEVSLPDGVAASERERTRARVLREARAAASLNHPAAVMIFDVVDHDGQTFIVMELLDGVTLVELVESEGPMTPARTARWGLGVLGALETAHGKGIVHRDVKPANVMVMPDGGAKLSDFGIATLQDDTRITSTGLVLGSPSFMAPEQASGAPSSPESDLWGLGATMYYAVEGVAPFPRPGVIPTLAAIINEPPRPMERAGPLAPLIEGLLAKAPAERPRPTAVRAALDQVSGAERAPAPTQAQPAAPPAHPVASSASFDSSVQPLDSSAPAGSAGVASRRPGAEPASRRAGAGSKRRSLVAAGLVGALIALVASFFWVRALFAPTVSQRPGASGAGGGGGDRGTGGDRGVGRREPRVPDHWSSFPIGETGYSVAYPPDWEEDVSGPTQTDLRDPDTGAYLRVAWTETPGPSPEAAWEELSADFGSRHSDYTEIRIDPTRFKGYEAAVWEYTYSEDGASLHAIDLGFVTGELGFALNFQTHEEDWEESQGTWRKLKASFSGG